MLDLRWFLSLFALVACAGPPATRTGLVPSPQARSAAPPNEPGDPNRAFRFVQITDTHFTNANDNHRARAQEVVQAINDLGLPIDFIVLTGDISQAPGEGLPVAKEILGRLNGLLYVLPGNHDIDGAGVNHGGRAYLQAWGALAYKVEDRGVVLLLLYDMQVPSLGYDPLGWLEAELTAAEGKPIIVFHHRPEVDDFYNNQLHPTAWKEAARVRWTELLNRYHVIAEITGHFHRDEQHWIGNVPLYVAPPVAPEWGRQSAFRIYEYRDRRLSYSTQYVE